jgi:hypothetical protein
MRSMPDLIVYDRESNRTSFVEVKFRSANSPLRVSLPTRELSWSQKYWNDCIWIVVIPVEHNFYAQKVANIRLFDQFKTHRYDLTTEFRPIEEEFPKVTTDNILRYCTIRENFLINGSSHEAEE